MREKWEEEKGRVRKVGERKLTNLSKSLSVKLALSGAVENMVTISLTYFPPNKHPNFASAF